MAILLTCYFISYIALFPLTMSNISTPEEPYYETNFEKQHFNHGKSTQNYLNHCFLFETKHAANIPPFDIHNNAPQISAKNFPRISSIFATFPSSARSTRMSLTI